MSKKDKDYTGFPGDCNATQLKALSEFRNIVNQMGLSDKLYDDPYLLRFLRARKFDIHKTQIMFVDFIKWRKENDVDNINTYMFTELPQVRVHYPHGYHKTDKIGRPIYIERIGMLQLNKLFEITTEQRLMKYYIQSYELLLKRIFPACSQSKGTRIEQTFTILDLKGGSMKMVSKQVYNFIQLASNIGQNNYPEILGKMYIVNAPMMFTGIWAMIKIWLDEKTKNKITILGSSYKDELLKHIDIDNLPDFLGGNSKCENTDALSLNIGPWNPDGTKPLFPVEQPQINEQDFQQIQQQQQQTQEDEDQKQQLDQLKSVLADMQFSAPVDKAPHNPNKYEVTTQNNHIVSDTPLNTEVGEEENQFSQQQQEQLQKQLQQE